MISCARDRRAVPEGRTDGFQWRSRRLPELPESRGARTGGLTAGFCLRSSVS